ncbi:TadE/TadG family type IV pilus assembly protein [Devosia sp. A449]
MPFGGIFRRFLGDGSGNVAIMVAAAFLPILIIAGGATDIARHEAYRVQLQDGVDRAVLAAASLTQTRPVEATVADYLKTLPFIDAVTLKFTQVNAINRREVSVQASYEMATAFLPLIGINSISVNAGGTAVERRSKIELSLTLDLSGSMDGSKYTTLKSAATTFVRTLLTPESSVYTTMSIVPYAGQVNVGQTMFAALGGKRLYTNSSCFNLTSANYASGLIDFTKRTQAPNFTRWNSTADKPKLNPNLNASWCPSENTAITYLSNDVNALVARIAGLQMYDGTGSAIALNYGLMLLNPAAQPLVQTAIANGLVKAEFANRPAPYGDADTLKVLVLMTDGAITEQYTAKDPSKSDRAPDNWVLYRDPVSNVQETSTVTKTYLSRVCAEARAKGVVVFTIGFQLRDSVDSELKMKQELRDCASSPSQYFDVAGLDIASAFQTIATSIQKIKLTN